MLLREEIKRLNTQLSETKEAHLKELDKIKVSKQQLQHEFMKYKADSVQNITKLKLQ